ncbi:MAG: putative toxin-antitoxin system toxin component, PIN family [Acidobacteriales bacterium 59-55]|nr:putative toxin-antitoxin system toxin component, PIN family [Terriglobales bacterium]ODU55721.1 MAG: putative toxin-antitoxin system toxin component, PIN family [Granulicella sp. SCN 62-9]OJV40918.1 MAG: putative toxin-antitoxin system toxin component, PIN family [Acidobacteriales bacterium 59-55]
MRLVLDTSVVVAAFRSGSGASNRLLQMADEGRFILLATPALFLEYEDVLSRPEQRKAHGISTRDLELLMRDLASLIEPVEVHFRWRPQLRDANDEMVLEAAMNGRADALVTHNRKDFLPVLRDFRLRILSPAEAVKEMSQ